MPVTWKALSPDGLHYASINGSNSTQAIHITDAVTGTDRAFPLPVVHGAWSIVEYTEVGIYLNAFQGMEGEPGLWLVQPNSGNVVRLDDGWNWTEVDNAAAWGVAYDEHGHGLKRLDLNTRAVSGLLYPPASARQTLSLLALDGEGHAVVSLSDAAGYLTAIMLVDEYGRTVSVALPSQWTGTKVAVYRGFRMSSGVWLTGYGFGLALISGGTLWELTKQPEVYAVSGGCN